jgi:hypothetical protein
MIRSRSIIVRSKKLEGVAGIEPESIQLICTDIPIAIRVLQLTQVHIEAAEAKILLE